MNKLKFSFFILPLSCLFLFSSCTNLFHDLLPSDKKEIIDFQIQDINGICSEKHCPNEDNNIEIVVPNDTDVKNLIPVVSISEGSEIVPLTVSYMAKIFPEKDILTLAIDMYLARENGTFESWFINLILDNGGIEIPKLDMPIDFSTPVIFVVISGSGNYEFYTVTVKKELPTQDDDDDDNTPDEPEIKEETDNFILSFKVPNQIGESKIYNSIAEIEDEELNEDINSIGDKVPYSGLVSFEVGADFDLKEVIPTVTVSEGAKILPLTEEYILSLGISFVDMINFYSGYSTTTNVERYISDFLKKQNNIVYPEINIPLNFDNTNVSFAVVSESGSIKIYNVKCKQIELNPKLTKIIFSKLNNEFLCKDSIGTITDNTIKATCMHPMEMEFDYGLIPEFVYEGDRVTFTMKDGIETELISGVTKIPFTETNRICVISVYIGSGETEKKIEYELYCPIEYDPDSIRSIIDFRFYKTKNTQIKNTVLASIHNEGDTGFITATVMYEGDVVPYELVADFVSPGTVTKNGTEIISGATSENFEYSTQYLCTSKNGLYCRLYDISIKFMQIVTIEPVINSFEFPSYLNKDLSKDCIAQIDELTKTIRCEVLYHSSKPPYDLIPSFVSSGTVTCDGMTQTSGFSGQNFRYTNYYTVTTGDIELSTSRYRIEVVFLKDDSSSCDILDFGFKIENNASLSSDVQATVTERTQKIFAFMPYGAGSQSGTLLTPTFTSNGTVTVNGQSQTSGISSQDFSSPVTYTVTSLNGLYTKEYVVSLQESGSIIYVDKNAVGRNNGTSWDDAFINLDTALEYVSTIDDSVLQEVWITADEYEPILNSKNGFNVRSNLILRGGFEGFESTSNERTVDSENCLVNHTVLKRTPFTSNEESLFYANKEFTGTFTIDGFDIDLEQTANETFLDITKVLNPKEATQNHSLEINNCLFNIKTQNSSCRFYYSEKDPSELHDTISKPTNNATIENTKITLDSTSKTFSVTSHTGQININNAQTNCPLYFVGDEVNIENSSFDNQLSSVYDTTEPSMYFTNINNQDSYANIKNSYFNNMYIEAYYDVSIESSNLDNSKIITVSPAFLDLNVKDSKLNLLDTWAKSYFSKAREASLMISSLCVDNSIIKAQTIVGYNLIQIESSEISLLDWNGWADSPLYQESSFIKNSVIQWDSNPNPNPKIIDNLFLYNRLSIGNEDFNIKDLTIENSKIVTNYIYIMSENLTIRNSEFCMFSSQFNDDFFESYDYTIFYRAENFILDGNNFDSSLFVKDNDSLYSDENEVRMLFYSDYSCDCYSAEIKNNTFGNFFELSLPFENTKIEHNYFKTGASLGFGYNSSIKNNTFEDLEWISGGNILEYENNKVINKNSKRGYKCISATEFPYTEFNYENFCYFYSSGELVFNNCIFEPCTQTYSLPQGDFTFGANSALNFGSGYVNINNSTISLNLSNQANLTINNCTAPNMKSISNLSNGVLSINDSTVTLSDSIINYGKITVDECKTFNTDEITNNTAGSFAINNSTVTVNTSIVNAGKITVDECKTFNTDEITNNTAGLITINDSTVTANYINNNSASTEYEFNNVSCSFIEITNSGTFTMNDSTVTNGNQIDDKGTLTINNSNINLTSTDGTNILQSTGNLSINGGTFNLKSTQGGNSFKAKGSLSINGGTFNFEHAGRNHAPMEVQCDATISNAKFNFTGDEYTMYHCVYFRDGTNGSTIKNCEFIIDKCASGGIYIWQDELKIENSKFDINVYMSNGDYTSGLSVSSSDFTINGGTYDFWGMSGLDHTTIKNATVSFKLDHNVTLGGTVVIESSTINCNLQNNARISNYSDHIKDTNFNFSGESGMYPWENFSSKLTNCNFDFTNCNIRNYGVRWGNSGTISNCTFKGAINSVNSSAVRGGAFYLKFNEENQVTVFENCTFSNNKITNGSSSVTETGGGAIAIDFSANNCSVKFKDCNFTNNYSCSGLASHIWAAANWTTGTYTNCSILFSGSNNSMTGPTLSDFIPGKTFYQDEAIYINGLTLGYY